MYRFCLDSPIASRLVSSTVWDIHLLIGIELPYYRSKLAICAVKCRSSLNATSVMIMTDDNCTVEQAMILASVNHHSFFGSSQGVVKYIRPRIPCESVFSRATN